MVRLLILLFTHLGFLGAGFALGIYALPILTAPSGPNEAALEASMKSAIYKVSLNRDLKGSDFLHWGEGEISVNRTNIAHVGRLAPGPDYKLYLVPKFVETEEEFLKVKEQSRRVGEIKTFNGFLVEVPSGVDIEQYSAVVVWCEAFGEFITAAKYR